MTETDAKLDAMTYYRPPFIGRTSYDTPDKETESNES